MRGWSFLKRIKKSKMKFINYLQDITGIGIYPMISLLVFFLFFTGVTWFVFATPKKQMQQIAHIPLEQ